VHKASAFAELSSMIVTEDKVAGTGLPLSFIEESQIISREPLSTRGSLIF